MYFCMHASLDRLPPAQLCSLRASTACGRVEEAGVSTSAQAGERSREERVEDDRRTAFKSLSSPLVTSQLTHASVMLTPRLSPSRPLGAFWAPSSRFDSSMMPQMPFEPDASCEHTEAMTCVGRGGREREGGGGGREGRGRTLGWLRWSFCELACCVLSTRVSYLARAHARPRDRARAGRTEASTMTAGRKSSSGLEILRTWSTAPLTLSAS